MTQKILFDPFPRQIEYMEAVFSWKYNVVIYGGSIRSGKSFSAIAILVLLCKMYPKSRWAIIRKDMPTIEKNIFPVIDKLLPEKFVKKDARRATNNPRIEFTNGSQVLFFAENSSCKNRKYLLFFSTLIPSLRVMESVSFFYHFFKEI